MCACFKTHFRAATIWLCILHSFLKYLILIGPLNCIIDRCQCFNFNSINISCPCVYLFIKLPCNELKNVQFSGCYCKINRFRVIQDTFSSHHGLFCRLTLHYPCVFCLWLSLCICAFWYLLVFLSQRSWVALCCTAVTIMCCLTSSLYLDGSHFK